VIREAPPEGRGYQPNMSDAAQRLREQPEKMATRLLPRPEAEPFELSMATQRLGNLTFVGELRVRVESAGFTDNAATFLSCRSRCGLVVFGITSRYPPQLWIRSPMIHFDGVVGAAGPGDVSAWKVGCLQSISHAHWVGHYANGQEVKYRLNTDEGPLKDGMAGSLFYEDCGRLGESGDPFLSTITIHDADALQMAFWLEYSGDPYRPHAVGAKGNHLVRTSGLCHYRTFLAAVKKSANVLVILAECRWAVNWEGDYDHVAFEWTPHSSPEMISHEIIDAATLHEHLACSHDRLPFSLLLAKAEQFLEVETRDGWMICRESLPDPECRDRPTNRRWGEPRH